MIWKDRRLKWDRDKYNGIHSIRVSTAEVWVPDLEVMNRVHDFPLVDEKMPRPGIIEPNSSDLSYIIQCLGHTVSEPHQRISLNHHGRVWLKRFFRMRANFKPFVRNYPYDKQQPTLVIASADNDEDIMELVHKLSISCVA